MERLGGILQETETQCYAWALIPNHFSHPCANRSGVDLNCNELARYAYSGHSVLMGKMKKPWQNTQRVLGMFGEKQVHARRLYRSFVKRGIAQGRREDLTGGGFLRSAGGWEGVKALREEKRYQRSDERILGDGDFVERILSSAEEAMEKRYALRARGVDLALIASRVSEVLELQVEEVWGEGRKLGISIPSVSESVTRGRRIADAKGCRL